MLNRLVEAFFSHRLGAFLLIATIAGYGAYSAWRIPVDAFPDLTNNQVVVTADCPAMAPSEVEMLVTFPIETALMGLPRTEQIRSISKFGLAMVVVVFDDAVNTFLARQLVNERLQQVRSQLPADVAPAIGPMATAFGEIFQYTIEGPQSARDKKTFHDWQIKPQLRTVAGVNEVNTWGGQTLQYQVEVDPAALTRYSLTLRDVFAQVRDNNENFGGGYIEHGPEQYNVRGLGRVRSVADLEQTVIRAHQGTPVLLKDVARVKAGSMPRQGASTRDGMGETVSGMVIMLKGENGKAVIERVKQRIASLRLPEGMRLTPFYDQSAVIDSTIRTVRVNLLEGGALVVLVLVLFLGNLRAALLVAAVIPLSMLAGFAGMSYFGITANLMSLGAIDFGMIVDGAVVMVENAVRRLGHARPATPREVRREVLESAKEVARPVLFGVLIIIAVYMPIFLLEGLEGRMFRPMAVTVCAALAGSLVLALLAVPAVFAAVFRRGVLESQGAWLEPVRERYRRLLRAAAPYRVLAVMAAAGIVAAAVGSVPYLGSEFMPRMDEGSILIETRKLPGISVTESVAVSTHIEQVVRTFPEVSGVVTKLGRPDLATEAMGVYQGDVYVLLKPREQWTRFQAKEELIAALDQALQPLAGVAFNFTQPMAMRLDETVSGVKADLAVKIFGSDSAELARIAERALRVLSATPGAADAQMELASDVAELRVQADRAALARYALNVTDLREAMEVVSGGRVVSQWVDNQRRFDIVLRLPDSYRSNLDAIRDLIIPAPGGERVRFGQVARVFVDRGPEEVSRENGQRRIVVQSNVRGRDLGGFVADVERRLAREVPLPPGYRIEYGGQFENQSRATQRLAVVLPLTLAIMTAILYATFHSMRQALLILLNVPFAFVGGIAALWIRGLHLNLSSSIGFIALFGVSVLNGIVLVTAINRLRASGLSMPDAVVEGAVSRLRPVLMTALVAGLGFLPMALATTTGAEVQRPLATVVVGGLASSAALTLFLLPLVYPWFSAALPADEKDAEA